MKLHTLCLSIAATAILAGCGTDAGQKPGQSIKAEAQSFIDAYTKEYQRLYVVAQEKEWQLNTRIVDGDTLTKYEMEKALEELAVFTGSTENIETTKKFLAASDSLTPLQALQLKMMLYKAAANPATIPDIVKARIKAGAKQTEDLFGFRYVLDGDTVSTNDIDNILSKSRDEAKLRRAWEASKEVGKALKNGVEQLRDLRNQSVQALGYSDYFAYQVSDYGMTTKEMVELCNRIVADLWPLYRELHTWTRHELARKFSKPVPVLLPAHWLPNRWGQGWGDIVEVKGLDVDAALKDKTPEWIVQQGEAFYVSLGFDSLPAVFWEKSSLYPLAKDAGYMKNNHASAWHMDYENDVRSLMSVEANARWWGTTLHELGHIYYYISYTNPDVPLILREGANRGYHEGIGSLLGLAAMQKPFLTGFGLADAQAKTDSIRILLREALDNVVFIPWSAGVMTMFEHDLYADSLPADQFNQRWWEYVKRYQGIAPPAERGEEFCDAASKTHINDDPAQYYDYAISYVLMYQFHDYIAKNILKQDPRATNYFGNKEVGKFLRDVMRTGATVDWRTHLKNSIGTEMTAQPMLDYFQPLMTWLKEQNKGRQHTLPEMPVL